MTIRNLDALFAPKAIALIGASNQPRSVGNVIAHNLFDGGFAGPVLTVNPHEQAIRSALSYRSIAELPVVPDLAVVATPPPTVPGLVAELGAKGCRAAVVVTAGFGEGERVDEAKLRTALLEAAQPHLLRIVGPNCLGFISPAAGINASFAHLMPAGGSIAFVTQSGALATAVIDWASARGIGFSHVISVGDMADVDFGDLLDYLALDRATSAILLYIEGVTNPRKFMSAGRIASRSKPVIVMKSGRSAGGAKAALSHTGALAGSDIVYDAAFRRAGMLRVDGLRELFEAVATLAHGLRPKGDRLTILTNGGGAGVLASDALELHGGRLATFPAATLARLERVLPSASSRANPVDILGDASEARYGAALEVLLGEPASDAVLVMNCPTAVADGREAAAAVIKARTAAGKEAPPILTCWLGETSATEPRRLFSANGIPTYETPDEAVRAFMNLVEFRRNQEMLLETPPSESDDFRPDREEARAIVRRALDERRAVLTEPEAKALLEAYRVPCVATRIAREAATARRLAEEIGKPVALKIHSPDITHKSDVGGVRLDLTPGAAVEHAAGEMLATVAGRAPGARLEGFVVEEMIHRPHALELLAGIAVDPIFGPVILFGQGGTATEIVADRAAGLPPLNLLLAKEMIRRTRVARLLGGYRDRPAVALDELAATLVKLSQLVADMAEVTELDINPLLADEQGVIALDARVVVREAERLGHERLAIRPYPTDLDTEITLDGGRRLRLRPIRPDDTPRLVDLVAHSTSEDVRLRFLGHLKELPQLMAARLSQIDYDREMAFVATAVPGDGTSDEILGVVRLAADPDNRRAEYALMVRSDLKGRGLGYQLMSRILAYARRRGLKTVFGEVLRENATMLKMAAEFGFTMASSDSADVVEVRVDFASVPASPGSG